MAMQNCEDQNLRITDVSAQIFNVPLAEVLTDAKHGDHTHFELITATVRLADGNVGTGYTYTGGKGGQWHHQCRGQKQYTHEGSFKLVGYRSITPGSRGGLAP